MAGEIQRSVTTGMSSSSTRTVALPAPPALYSGEPAMVAEISPSPSFTRSAPVVSLSVTSLTPTPNETVVSGKGPVLSASVRVAALMILLWPRMLIPTDMLFAVEPVRLRRNSASSPSVTVACSAVIDTVEMPPIA